MNRKKEAWGEKAAEWDAQAQNPDNKFTRFIHTTASLIERQGLGGGRALDIGCGPGLLSRLLVDLGFDVCGTDISPEMVRDSIQRLRGKIVEPESRFRICEDGQIPFEGMAFDLITALQVFPYIERYSPYITRMISLLAPGGLIVASNTNRLSLNVFVSLVRAFLRFFSIPPRLGAPRAMWNLVRTGYPSGGYVDYRRAQQAYSAATFDRLFRDQGMVVVDEMNWYHLRPLDREPLARAKLAERIARRLSWYHVGVYHKAS